jgi:hypothetical protein
MAGACHGPAAAVRKLTPVNILNFAAVAGILPFRSGLMRLL